MNSPTPQMPPAGQRLIKATSIKLTEYIPHVPHPKQQAFLWLECFEALFGGAAGGGKSDALLMAALQWVDVPGYAAILFRKTLPELRLAGSLIPRSQEWLNNTAATWNDNNKQWTFPSGATLSFGFMKNDDDRHRYQSAEYQFVGFDELTHFTELQYTYMMSRVRRPVDLDEDDPLSRVPLRIRSATNPGGRGHRWVRDRFVTKVAGDEGPKASLYAKSRIFIPSFLPDNPSLDRVSYEYALSQTDEDTRAQLLEGNWDARQPGQWVIKDPTYLDAAEALGAELWDIGVDQLPPDKKGRRPLDTITIDWGEHTQSYVVWPLVSGGIFIPPSEVIGEHEDPVAVTLRILERADKLQKRSGRPLINKSNYDAAGVQSMRSYMATARKKPGHERMKSLAIPFQKYKKESIGYLRILLTRTAVGKTSRVIAIHPDNTELLRQLRGWEFKKVNDRETEEIDKHDDHGPDALLAGIAPTAARHRAYVEKIIQRAKEKKEPT
jgi:hypothetical protein